MRIQNTPSTFVLAPPLSTRCLSVRASSFQNVRVDVLLSFAAQSTTSQLCPRGEVARCEARDVEIGWVKVQPNPSPERALVTDAA
jgi:hypothetical protein